MGCRGTCSSVGRPVAAEACNIAPCTQVPLYAMYALTTHVLLPMWSRPKLPDMPESEAERKRREKRDRQANRAAKFSRQ